MNQIIHNVLKRYGYHGNTHEKMTCKDCSFNFTVNKLNMRISTEKTKYMAISTLEIEGKIIEQYEILLPMSTNH